MTGHAIEPMRPCDRNFVFHSWLRSYRASPLTYEWPSGPYELWAQRMIERTIGRPRARVDVARPEDWPEGIVGWACTEQQPGEFIIHYGFTKRRLRRTGIFWGLIESLKPEGRLVFAHLRQPYTDTLLTHGYKHAPERAEG